MKKNRISASAIRIIIASTVALSMLIGTVFMIYRLEIRPASTSQLHALSSCAKDAALGLPTSHVITANEIRQLEEDCQKPLASAQAQREAIQYSRQLQ